MQKINSSILKYKNPATGEFEAFPLVVGKSAYDIAREHGFEGTEEEWADSLVTGDTLYLGDDAVESTVPINADTLNGYTAEEIKSDLQTQIDDLNTQMGDVSSALDAILGV